MTDLNNTVEVTEQVAEKAVEAATSSGNGKQIIAIATGAVATVVVGGLTYWIVKKVKSKLGSKQKEVVNPEVVDPTPEETDKSKS